MQTLHDPTPIGFREAEIPDLDERGLVHTTQTPGGCTCGKNYAKPAYRPCVHVALVRSGAPLDDVRVGVLEDATPVYKLQTKDAYYSHRTHGYRPGLWEHTLCFDGATFYVESRHADTAQIRTVVLDGYRPNH